MARNRFVRQSVTNFCEDSFSNTFDNENACCPSKLNHYILFFILFLTPSLFSDHPGSWNCLGRSKSVVLLWRTWVLLQHSSSEKLRLWTICGILGTPLWSPHCLLWGRNQETLDGRAGRARGRPEPEPLVLRKLLFRAS